VIELDLLADYATGVLDGTPEGARVAQLVGSDPAWARAYADLTAADQRVTNALAGLGTERMPDDVGARIARALAGERSSSGAGSTRTPVISLDEERRRRRWKRTVGIAAAVAGVAAFGAIGANIVSHNSTTGGGLTNAAPGADSQTQPESSARNSAAPPGIAGAPGGTLAMTIQSSGRDYQPETLKSARGGIDSNGVPASDPAAIPAELSRLSTPTALNDCVTAITTRYGGRVVSVDFARFQGAPALIARTITPVQTVVVGPDCGLAGADARYQTAG